MSELRDASGNSDQAVRTVQEVHLIRWNWGWRSVAEAGNMVFVIPGADDHTT
eukprot:CAMPEP_0174295872 /NCGR_PEP_ID=MMETSP0809-20121228/46115_1 /TAXON_ID=73025 ORGANISM="Eutreptiella gymnastica-like, Strain CCMP1594" /NCGR_SAMPLE_ID=MMETSP0809 /ASSEMBLY_ACC=CAM_ASM_000658 /LENGTH=51 /DNA_ID=CAMNT_0015398475 /DNA_START=682 /DNA_END=837 /DNA_ORIENTATION=-